MSPHLTSQDIKSIIFVVDITKKVLVCFILYYLFKYVYMCIYLHTCVYRVPQMQYIDNAFRYELLCVYTTYIHIYIKQTFNNNN